MTRWRAVALCAAAALVLAACGGGGQGSAAPSGSPAGADPSAPSAPSGDPIRIGSTLPLTGFLAATGAIHKVTGEEYIAWLNERGGLLGRPVEWVLLDDESSPDVAASLYERLITEEQVDLVVGPYGSANTSAAMEVARRHSWVFPHHTASLSYSYDYEWHFPLWAIGLNASVTGPSMVFDAYLSLEDAPSTVGFAINKFPATNYLAYGHEEDPGAVEVAAEKGLEVVLDLQYDIGTTDWAPIARRIADADPDLFYMGDIGAEAPNLLAALAQIGWTPRHHFYQYPTPGPMLAAGDLAEGATSTTLFLPHEPFLDNEGADVLMDRYPAAAEAAGLDYTTVDIQASTSWALWQVVEGAVAGCDCLDHPSLADHLLNNGFTTVIGEVDFDPEQNNYYGDLSKLMQIQDGEWYVVYPTEFAAPDRSLEGN